MASTDSRPLPSRRTKAYLATLDESVEPQFVGKLLDWDRRRLGTIFAPGRLIAHRIVLVAIWPSILRLTAAIVEIRFCRVTDRPFAGVVGQGHRRNQFSLD